MDQWIRYRDRVSCEPLIQSEIDSSVTPISALFSWWFLRNWFISSLFHKTKTPLIIEHWLKSLSRILLTEKECNNKRGFFIWSLNLCIYYKCYILISWIVLGFYGCYILFWNRFFIWRRWWTQSIMAISIAIVVVAAAVVDIIHDSVEALQSVTCAIHL